MAIEVRLSKHQLWMLVLIVSVGVVIGYGTNDPAAFGHSSGEVDVTLRGNTISLQQAINVLDADIIALQGGAQPPGPGPQYGLQTTTGTIEITQWDGSGGTEQCWFRISVDGNQWYPQSTCTGTGCQQSANLNEITNEKCHNYIQWFLRDDLNISFVSQRLGVPGVIYFNVKNYDNTAPNALNINTVTDATFNFEYIVSNPPGQPLTLTCPSSCEAFSAAGLSGTCNPSTTTPSSFPTPCCTMPLGYWNSPPGIGCWPNA